MPISRIKTDGIQDDAITSAKIGVDVIVADDLAANSVTVSELTDGAVTGAKLANNLNYDSGTLYLDSTNNRVGMGTITPSKELHVKGDIDVEGDTSGVAVLRFKAEEIHGTVEGINIGNNFGGLAFKTNNNGTVAEKVRIDSSGSVGIGTSSPDRRLQVRSDENDQLNCTIGLAPSTVDTVQGGIGVKSGGIMGFNAVNVLTFNIGGADGDGASEVARIDSSGNMAIGTSSMTRFFNLNDTTANAQTAYFKSTNASGGAGLIAYNNTGQASTFQLNGSSNTAYGGANSLNIGSITNNPVVFLENNTERMRIVSGNVAIGTTTATGKLTVDGGFLQVQVGGTQTIRVGSTDHIVGGTDNDAVLQSNTGKNMRFLTGGTERMRIDSSGYVGIGTTTVSHPLDIHKQVAGAVIRTVNTRDASGTFGIKSVIGYSGANVNNTSSAHFHGNTNGVGNWYLFANGTTSFSSDERLKKNIESTRDGYLEDLAKLRVVKYNWKNSPDGSAKELGLIAQEVEKVFPNLIQDDLDTVSDNDDNIYKLLKQSVLPFMLLKAIQELSAKNDAQQTLIESMEARITALESN